jgi:cytochrome c553
MKRTIVLGTVLISLGLLLLAFKASIYSQAGTDPQEGVKKLPEMIQLGKEAKLGVVNFNHAAHTTKNRNIEGTGPIACIECHHTAQPASEVAKHPPLKTAWPADRTTTLTAELMNDPKAPPVEGCHNCHSRAGTKPELLPALPEMKSENSTSVITLTNQQAFHRTCSGCHDQVVKTRKDVTPPTAQKCMGCHKKAAA